MQTLAKTFEAADLPARCAKFVPRKQWVVTGSDDMFIRVFNYNTLDKEKMFEAHGDYIRSIAVHPSLPYLLSCSDDMLIKLWDWDKGWACTQIFEGHAHYVMQVRPTLCCRTRWVCRVPSVAVFSFARGARTTSCKCAPHSGLLLPRAAAHARRAVCLLRPCGSFVDAAR